MITSDGECCPSIFECDNSITSSVVPLDTDITTTSSLGLEGQTGDIDTTASEIARPNITNTCTDNDVVFNEGLVPNKDICDISCHCLGGQIQCEKMHCQPPPPGLNCTKVVIDNECCPTYDCVGQELPLPGSDSHIVIPAQGVGSEQSSTDKTNESAGENSVSTSTTPSVTPLEIDEVSVSTEIGLVEAEQGLTTASTTTGISVETVVNVTTEPIAATVTSTEGTSSSSESSSESMTVSNVTLLVTVTQEPEKTEATSQTETVEGEVPTLDEQTTFGPLLNNTEITSHEAANATSINVDLEISTAGNIQGQEVLVTMGTVGEDIQQINFTLAPAEIDISTVAPFESKLNFTDTQVSEISTDLQQEATTEPEVLNVVVTVTPLPVQGAVISTEISPASEATTQGTEMSINETKTESNPTLDVTTLEDEIQFDDTDDEANETESATCQVNGKTYNNLEDVPNASICKFCQCFNGEVVCAERECLTPTGYENCQPLPVVEGECCPTAWECDKENESVTETSSVFTITKETTTSTLPSSSVSSSFTDEEPEITSPTDSSTIRPEEPQGTTGTSAIMETSGTTVTSRPLDGSSTSEITTSLLDTTQDISTATDEIQTDVTVSPTSSTSIKDQPTVEESSTVAVGGSSLSTEVTSVSQEVTESSVTEDENKGSGEGSNNTAAVVITTYPSILEEVSSSESTSSSKYPEGSTEGLESSTAGETEELTSTTKPLGGSSMEIGTTVLPDTSEAITEIATVA